MAKMTSKTKSTGRSAITVAKTVNKAGGEAFELKTKEKFVTGILTSFVKEEKYYGDNTPEIVAATREMIKEDPVFVAKAACYARNVFHMRSISHMIAAEVARGAKGNRCVRRMINKVIERPDDMANIIAYHLKTWGKRQKNPIPRGLRRGIADVFPKFDEYSLGKYKGLEDDVKLRDVLLISRPKPENEEQASLWKKVIEGTLETPETRETILSEQGQSKEVWEKIIDGKTGYMMLIRNLKNMLEQKISDTHLTKVCNILKDPDQVRKSKQLPFRFYSAYRMVKDLGSLRSQRVLDALEEALSVSFENLPRLKGTTAIIVDESGSMNSKISEKSVICMRDIGNLLAAASSRYCENSVAIPFGATAKRIALSSRSSIFDNMEKMEHSGVGHSTNLHEAFSIIDGLDEKVDRIIIFSDMQAYGDGNVGYGRSDSCQTWTNKYRNQVPHLWIHSIDLAGYGTTKVCGNRVNLIAGWSEKVLEFISQVEEGGSNLVKAIENYVM